MEAKDLRIGAAIRSGPLEAVCGAKAGQYDAVAAISGGELSVSAQSLIRKQ
jgi:hypothetical protein